mgnify:CR=1 FL=1
MTSRWGPVYWKYIHMITNEYPDNPNDNEINNHYELIQKFMDTIPCPICKRDIRRLINNHKLKAALKSRNTFMKYFWNIHNLVNKKLYKPILSFNKFKLLYKSSYRNAYWVRNKGAIKNLIICILIIIILYTYYRPMI